MIKTNLVVISFTIFASAAALAWLGWRNRAKRQTAIISAPLEALEYFGEQLSQVSAFYVATTFAADHLDRINAYGLGARGQARALVFTEGLLIVRNGERPLAIAKEQVLSVVRSSAVIDKAVETDGLLTINWIQGKIQLATHLRVVELGEAEKFIEAVKQITVKEVSN